MCCHLFSETYIIEFATCVVEAIVSIYTETSATCGTISRLSGFNLREQKKAVLHCLTNAGLPSHAAVYHSALCIHTIPWARFPEYSVLRFAFSVCTAQRVFVRAYFRN